MFFSMIILLFLVNGLDTVFTFDFMFGLVFNFEFNFSFISLIFISLAFINRTRYKGFSNLKYL